MRLKFKLKFWGTLVAIIISGFCCCFSLRFTHFIGMFGYDVLVSKKAVAFRIGRFDNSPAINCHRLPKY